MLPSPSDRMPRARTERILIARVITAVGLALLLVVGAWSASHGTADLHSTLCLASGVSHPAGASPAASDTDGATAIDVLSSDAGICVIAALCCVALTLLFRRLAGHGARALTTRAALLTSPPGAGPSIVVPALTLTQLSISRT
jgi:hypothetical protein